MIRKLFLDRPASVGESYGEHAVFGASIGWTMDDVNGITRLLRARGRSSAVSDNGESRHQELARAGDERAKAGE